MRKNFVHRGDIWMVNLLFPQGDVLRGAHPAIVVSSDLTNRNSKIWLSLLLSLIYGAA